jgi:WD40 repeat protein
MSRLSRQCGILNISQPYRRPRPVTGITLLYFTLLYFTLLYFVLPPSSTVLLLTLCKTCYSCTNFPFCSFLQTFRHGFPFQPTAIAFDPVQRLLAVGTKSGSLRLYPFKLQRIVSVCEYTCNGHYHVSTACLLML